MANEKDYNPISYEGNGSTCDFAFGWKVLKDSELVVTITDSDGVETTLDLGSDYTATVENVGGNVTLATAPAEGEKITISRNTSQYQSSRYSTSVGFQGSEIENSFDKVSLNLQEMSYNIETFKTSFSSETNDKIDTNKADTDKQIDDNKTDTDSKIAEFEAEVNNKIQQVNEAVQKLNRLDEVLEECETYAESAGNSSASSEEQSIIAQQQAELAKGYSDNAEEVLATFRQEQEAAISDIQLQQQTSEEEMNALQSSLLSNIQSLGIYMKDDRLFYVDSSGVEHEFRNDFGGIAPMAVKHKEIKKVDNGFALTWTDPDDSEYEDNVYCTWAKTVIVRKLGSYPESPYDGDIVLTETVRNTYASTAYVDEVDSTKDYKYRAFPCSINKVYSYDDKNKFGVWIYAFTELDTESNPAKRVTYLEDNKYFNENYMDFTNDIFNYADWKNSPFYSWDYIRPCMVYNKNAYDEDGNSLNGQVMEYLDPNDHSLTIDGTASHISDQTCNANAMVEKRCIFRKIVINGEYRTVYFSNEKLDDEYECYPCLRDDGTYNEFYYTPMFHGSLVNSTLASLAGGLTAISSKTAQNEIDYARANGDGWDTELWADIDMELDIFTLLFKNTDSQSVLGTGVTNSSSSLSSSGASGKLLDKGINYGTNTTSVPVKFRYRENFYAYQWQRFRGLIYIDNIPYVKMTKHTGDGSTATDYNITGDGYIALTDVPAVTGTSGGYISKTVSTKYGRFSTVVSGSSSTYLCDGRWFASGTMYPFRGGSSGNGLLCGAFCLCSYAAASLADWGLGAALSYKPL